MGHRASFVLARWNIGPIELALWNIGPVRCWLDGAGPVGGEPGSARLAAEAMRLVHGRSQRPAVASISAPSRPAAAFAHDQGVVHGRKARNPSLPAMVGAVKKIVDVWAHRSVPKRPLSVLSRRLARGAGPEAARHASREGEARPRSG